MDTNKYWLPWLSGRGATTNDIYGGLTTGKANEVPAAIFLLQRNITLKKELKSHKIRIKSG